MDFVFGGFMRHNYRIFLVEDDPVIARVVQNHLEGWGYVTQCATDFSDVLTQFTDFDPQLVLLDISLPFFNGYHWCAEIRKLSRVPILFLSSASDNLNLITAMNMGGDDFVAKPFELPVLTAKIQALLRRAYDFAAPTTLLRCGDAVLNTADGSLLVKGQRVELTKNEWKILQLLLEQKGKVVSRQALMTRLWESDAFIGENTLTVNVTRLRKKLEQAGYYFGIIFLFALGAGVGGNLSIAYGNKMIWVCSGLLLVSFLLMFIERFKASND